MDREILFRAKFGDEWKYGYLSVEPKGLVIKEPYKLNQSNIWHIDPETVGEYTGLTDKNGKKIFEGDIVDFHIRGEDESYGVVKYSVEETEFYLAYDNLTLGLGRNNYSWELEVIGNIHDTPELIKQED